MQPWDERYIDDGGLRPQDDMPVDLFLMDDDRAPLEGTGRPFFSGREPEINVFRGALAKMAAGKLANATIAAEGPPGCGKSALLDQFAAETNGCPEHKGRTWIAVPIEGAAAMSPSAIMSAVDSAIVKRLASEASTNDNAKGRLARLIGDDNLDRALEIAKEISDRGVGGFGFRIGKRNAPDPRDMAALYELREREWNGWNIVLLVDEAQEVSANQPGSHSGTLSSMHQGLARLPIIFCAFGLQGTFAALKRAGISRLANKRRISLLGLQDKHVEMAVRRAVQQYNVRNATPLVNAIVGRASGWPQHLALYLDAALDEAKPQIKSQGFADASKLDINAILAEGDEGRKRYYEGRLDALATVRPPFARYAKGLASQLRRANAPLSEESVISHVVEAQGVTEDVADDFLLAAKACGLVAADGDRNCFSPIPSFASHLAGQDSSPAPPRRRQRDSRPTP